MKTRGQTSSSAQTLEDRKLWKHLEEIEHWCSTASEREIRDALLSDGVSPQQAAESVRLCLSRAAADIDGRRPPSRLVVVDRRR